MAVGLKKENGVYIKKPPTKKLPCKQCGDMAVVSKHARSALCDIHRKERYPNKYKEPEPTIVEIIASEIVDMVQDCPEFVEKQFDELFPSLEIPNLNDFPELKRIVTKGVC